MAGVAQGQRIQFEVHGLGSSGEGIGRFHGLTVFVEGALPGEEVEAEVQLSKKSYARARLLRVIRPSEQRVEPPCPFYERCGGCQIMHMSYAEQLRLKRQRIVDALTRIGRLADVDVAEVRPSPSPVAYRNKIQLPVVTGADGTVMGLYARQSNDLVPIDACLIHCPLGEQVFAALQRLLPDSGLVAYDKRSGKGELRHVLIKTALATQQVLIVLVGAHQPSPALQELASALIRQPGVKGVVHNLNPRRDNVILGREYLCLAGEDGMEEELNGLRFEVAPASFFQVNPPQAEQLYAYAIATAQLQSGDRVIDAYCGVGTLTLHAAQKAGTVVGVELVPQAIENAKRNAARNGLANCTFYCGAVEDLLAELEPSDALFLNPPRKGCAPEVLEAIAQHQPLRVVYVSCDPATLARDVALLVAEGYKIEAVQPFDMFPQTMHVETVLTLVRRL
ncbi:MAG: 23S rRNA (uracil(1939)-C(5))-methyltransferase RlmD [Chlamydiia bacterium]|nr:23S rRNA (uracil(1939)-C(5))-methyltransferase RlmD [Chlamydiia bacterium]